MNDEIKEILDDLDYAKNKQRGTITLNQKDIDLLLDYITNLQQKIKHYEETQTFGDYVKEVNLLIDYKSRIEKAVKYIENTPLYETTYDYNMEEELEIQNVSDETASNKLLNILNGRSDE